MTQTASGGKLRRVNDTTGVGLERYVELLRAMPVDARFAQISGLTKMVRVMALAGIQHRFPAADENEQQIRLAVRLYGRDVAARLFGASAIPVDAI